MLVRIGIGRKLVVEEFALADTGFDEAVIIPETALDHGLGKSDGRGFWKVGDGRIISVPLYVGSFQILGGAFSPQFLLPIAVLGDDYIIGREILDKFEITLDHGKRVVVRP